MSENPIHVETGHFCTECKSICTYPDYETAITCKCTGWIKRTEKEKYLDRWIPVSISVTTKAETP